MDYALLWLGDEEESCFSGGVTLPAEDMALLDVTFQYLGIGATKGDGAASRLRPCSALESSSLS